MPSNLLLNEDNCPYWEEGADDVCVTVDYDGTPMWTYVGGGDDENESTLSIERSVNGGATWEPVLESSTGGSFEDFQGLSHGETLHRATITTKLGTSNTTTVSTVTESWAVWLGSGTRWENTARLPYDPALEITNSRDRTVEHYAEDTQPTAYAGTALTRKYAVGGRIIAGDSANVVAERFREITDAADPLILYRDPLGHRVWGAISELSTPYQQWGAWEWNLELTQAKGPYDV